MINKQQSIFYYINRHNIHGFDVFRWKQVEKNVRKNRHWFIKLLHSQCLKYGNNDIKFCCMYVTRPTMNDLERLVITPEQRSLRTNIEKKNVWIRIFSQSKRYISPVSTISSTIMHSLFNSDQRLLHKIPQATMY